MELNALKSFEKVDGSIGCISDTNHIWLAWQLSVHLNSNHKILLTHWNFPKVVISIAITRRNAYTKIVFIPLSILFNHDTI